MHRMRILRIAVFSLCAMPAFAQTSPAPADQAAPSAEALKLARTLTEKSGGGRLGTMEGLSLPMARLVRELQVGPAHGNAIIHEVIMPTLYDHVDDLTAIQVQSYATNLTVDDMKAAIAFYDSPAGRDLVRMRTRITTGNMEGVSKLIDSLQPEFEKRTDAVLKAHGWTKVAPPQLGGPRLP